VKIQIISAPTSEVADDYIIDVFVRFFSNWIEKMFDTNESLWFLAIPGDGPLWFFDIPDKGLAVGYATRDEIEADLKKKNISRYATAFEVEPEDHEAATRCIAMTVMEGENTVGCAKRDIIKHEHGKAYLGELSFAMLDEPMPF
jgi:hypothetical protein